MSNDNIARTIAALRQHATATALSCQELRAADILALCDAAEAGLRCPPREPTQEMLDAGYDRRDSNATLIVIWRAMYDAAPINEGGQDAAARKDAGPIANGLMAPVPPSPDALADFIKPTTPSTCVSRGYEIGERCADVTDCVKNGCAEARPAAPAPPSPDAALVERLRRCYAEHEDACRAIASPDGVRDPVCDVAEAAYAAARAIERLTAELAEAQRERDEQITEASLARESLQMCAKHAGELEAAQAEVERLRAAIRAISVRGPDGDGLVWIVCTMPNGNTGAVSVPSNTIAGGVFTAWREAAQAAIDAGRKG